VKHALIAVIVAAAALAGLSQARDTGVLAGVVVDAATAGVAGVELRAVDEGGAALFTGRTTAEGRFEVGGLPPGRYVVTAIAEGFLPASFGALGIGEPGVPVRITAGSRVSDLRIALERPATVGGRVVDTDGNAVPSLVHAMTTSWIGAQPSLRRAATTRTEAGGRYTIAGLVPGPYVILVVPTAEPAAAPDRMMGYPPTFYPGVTAAASAAAITVAPSEDARGIDVRVALEPVASMTVELAGAPGAAVFYPSLLLLSESAGEAGLQVDASPSGRPLGFARVPRGRYTLMASALQAAPDGVLERLWAVRAIDADGRAPVDIPLALGPGARFDGRVRTAEGAAPGLSDLPETWLRPIGADRPEGLLPFGGTLTARDDGAFTIAGVAPGRYVLQFGRDAAAPSPGWSIARVIVNGRDVADLPIDVYAGDRQDAVDIVVTNEPSELTGTLTDAAGRPWFDVTLVALPVDSQYWWTGTRRIRFVRPDTSGMYVMRGLPAGEYWLAAVSGRLPPEPTDPQWLGGLSAAAVRVLIAAGTRTVQDLRVR